MAANWNNPTLTSLYVDFLQQLKDRDLDALTMNPVGDGNLPAGAKRYDFANTGAFQSWTGVATSWANLILSVAGGGTGAATAAGARTNLGLGTMATQNSNAVAITGGTITGVNLNANDITSGIVALNRGGTGASLALGPPGSFLANIGASVGFTFQGGALVGLNASQVTVGNLPMAQMPTGGTWNITAATGVNLGGQYIQFFSGGFIIGGPAGGSMGANTLNAQAIYINGVPIATGAGIPSGMMAYFSGACPGGWTFVAGSQGRTVRSINGGAGGVGGGDTHHHGFSVPAGGGSAAYDRNSGVAVGEISGSGAPAGRDVGMDSGSGVTGWLAFAGGGGQHTHTIGHSHTFTIDAVPGFPGYNADTGEGDSWPPFVDYNLCRKD